MSSPHANLPNVRKNASLSHSWKVSSFLKIKKLNLKNKKNQSWNLFNCLAQGESGREARRTAPFSLRDVDMKEHIMSEIRGNYTGSAL